jgi:hypothetical protein
MNNNRIGGIALIVGSIGFFLTLGFHPAGHDFSEAGNQLGAVVAHTKAIHFPAAISLPLLFFGALVLSHKFSAAGSLATAAIVFYGFGMVAAVFNVVVDGFLAPDLIAKVLTATSTTKETWQTILSFNTQLNAALAKVFVVASSIAIALWSVALVRKVHFLGIYGILMTIAILVSLGLGYLSIASHTFRLVLLGQILWISLAGLILLRAKENETASATK